MINHHRRLSGHVRTCNEPAGAPARLSFASGASFLTEPQHLCQNLPNGWEAHSIARRCLGAAVYPTDQLDDQSAPSSAIISKVTESKFTDRLIIFFAFMWTSAEREFLCMDRSLSHSVSFRFFLCFPSCVSPKLLANVLQSSKFFELQSDKCVSTPLPAHKKVLVIVTPAVCSQLVTPLSWRAISGLEHRMS